MDSFHDEDPAALKSLLLRHRSLLSSTYAEVEGLREHIKELQDANESLRHEVASLKLELGHARDGVETARRIADAADVHTEKIGMSLNRTNQEHAAVIADMELKRSELIADHRIFIGRLSAQLEATQQPQSTSQPLPWKRVSAQADHPIHVIREVVLDDQKREERILQRNLQIVFGDNSYSGADMLEKLLSCDVPEPHSNDTAAWLAVAKRVYAVLKDRRLHAGITSVDGLGDFFLRSRNMMVSEIVQIHRDVNRCFRALSILRKSYDQVTSPASSLFAERQLDLAIGVLSDLDTLCHRTRQVCFSDIDRVIHAP